MKWFKTLCMILLCMSLGACKAEAAPLFERGPHDNGMQVGSIYVDIKGAVRNPGVYRVNAGTRLIHLVELSGGFKEDAAPENLVLSGILEDGKVYVIPSILDKDERPASEDENEEIPSPGEEDVLVCINTAGLTELKRLPGIGEATALSIIDHRTQHGPFERPEALMDVKNIGEKTFASLEALITLQP